MYRLLLLTHDRDVRSYIDVLKRSAFQLDEADYAVVESERFAADRFDFVLMDDGASPMSCVDCIRMLRATSQVPIMVLSDGLEVAECVVALEMGADDYVRKPVDDLELLARMKAILRRSSSERSTESLSQSLLVVEDVELHVMSRVAKKSGKLLDLTAVEFDLLKLLMESTGDVVTREVIAREVFRRRSAACNRSIDVHMSGLRKKLGLRGDESARIRTIRGFGYVYTNGEC